MKYCQSGRDSRNQGVGRRQKAVGRKQRAKADKRGFALKSRFPFAKRTNLIAGGNATESKRQSAATLKGSDFDRRFFDPFRVITAIDDLTVGAAHGYLNSTATRLDASPKLY